MRLYAGEFFHDRSLEKGVTARLTDQVVDVIPEGSGHGYVNMLHLCRHNKTLRSFRSFSLYRLNTCDT
jgi:hypothetical protein